MKRFVSLIAITTFAFSSVMSLFAQSRIPNPRSDRKPVKKNIPADNEFGIINAVTGGAGVLIEWQMAREKGNMGFNVFRTDGRDRVQVNQEFVFGSAAKAGRFALFGEEYSIFDRHGGLGSRYVIESTDLDGRTVVSSVVPASYSKLRGGIGPTDDQTSRSSADTQLRSEKATPPPDVLTAIGTPSLVTDPEIHKNIVMSRPGVRIGVKREGIYRVAADDLANAGFNTASDPATWQLYLNGVEQAIAVSPDASYFEFYGTGIDTIESEVQGYFLIVGDGPGKRIRNTVARPSLGTAALPSYDQTFTQKERINYLNTVFNGAAENWFGELISGGGRDIQFDLTGIDYSDPQSTLDLKLQGFSSGLHEVRVILNGQVLVSQNGSAQSSFGSQQTISTSLLRDTSLGHGPNVLNLASIAPGSDFNLFDTVSIKFNRKHAAIQNALRAYTVNSKITRLTGFASANTRVFDVSLPDDPRLITNISFQQQGASFGATIPAGRAMSFYAVEDSAIQTPVSITAYDGELLGVNTHSAELIIIAHQDFMAEAQNWANYRISQGVSVKIANIQEIFNEFNYGVLSAEAIETFLSYAHTNWQEQPKYVLLIGDASEDPRQYKKAAAEAAAASSGDPIPPSIEANIAFRNFVPTRIVTTLFSETGSDESLADFDDDGLAEMPVGRIPAATGAAVTAALAKVVNWEAGLAATNTLSSRGALFAFDVPNGYGFRQMSEGLRDQLPGGVISEMAPRGMVPPLPPGTTEFTLDPDAQVNLLAGMNNVICNPSPPDGDGLCTNSSGRYLVNYSGHGSTGTWAASTFFHNGNVLSLTNKNNESLFTLLTCLNGYFLSQNATPSLAENLLAHGNGGAIASWASTGLTTPDVQEVMGRRFYQKVGLEEPGLQRLGDLIIDAKGVISGGEDVRLSWSLLGDPMLKVWE